MFEVSVATSFHAIHAVTIAGVEETPHEHDWKVVASVQGDKLDAVSYTHLRAHET